MGDQADEKESGEDGSFADCAADHLSVMFPPCQDPLLVKIYKGLPALPCVVLIFFVNFAEAESATPSRRLCEVKAFTGSEDSLRTPFKDSCESMSKSEIEYVFTTY